MRALKSRLSGVANAPVAASLQMELVNDWRRYACVPP